MKERKDNQFALGNCIEGGWLWRGGKIGKCRIAKSTKVCVEAAMNVRKESQGSFRNCNEEGGCEKMGGLQSVESQGLTKAGSEDTVKLEKENQAGAGAGMRKGIGKKERGL